METRQPRVAVELPVTPDAGKREVTLRFRARAEVREHVAACVALMYLLPDDGLDEAGNVAAETVHWTLAELTEAISPMDRSQLRAVIADAHAAAPGAVENAIIWAPAGRASGRPEPARNPIAEAAAAWAAEHSRCPEHTDECDGACGGRAAHYAHLDDGGCPCCYCARYAVPELAQSTRGVVSFLPLSSERLHGARIGGTS